MKQHSLKFLQKRKFVMALPILVVPFLTMIFWALGGGAGSPVHAAESDSRKGLNLQLPDAHFNEEELTKLMLYEQAKRDSAKHREERENDPYFDLAMLEAEDADPEPGRQLPPAASALNADPNVVKVNNKLDELYRELNRKPGSELTPPAYSKPKPVSNDLTGAQLSSDIDKLGGMMEMMHKKRDGTDDPEMNGINGMLEKILDVQHPERVREKIKEQSKLSKGQVFSVQANAERDNINLIGAEEKDSLKNSLSVNRRQSALQNSFYGLGEDVQGESLSANAIEAVVHDTQELVVGSTVKMRLLSDVFINGVLVPKDQFVYGVAAINGERLNVSISSVRMDDSLFPVSLSAYDLDGIEGLYIPGAITRDVAKQSGDQAMQSMQFMTMDQSVGAQAASAGMTAAKGLFSKKVKLIKVTVKAGYKILLRDENSK